MRRHSSAVRGAAQGACSPSHAVLSAPGRSLLPLLACPLGLAGDGLQGVYRRLVGTSFGLVGALVGLVGEYTGLAGL